MASDHDHESVEIENAIEVGETVVELGGHLAAVVTVFGVVSGHIELEMATVLFLALIHLQVSMHD